MSRRGGRGGAPCKPTLYTHEPDRASVVRISSDGRRAHERPAAVKPQTSTPAHFQEDWAGNAAFEDLDNGGYAMGDDSLPPEVQGPEGDGITVCLPPKAKQYANSTWVGHRDEYLDKMLHLEGRGDFAVYSACGGCGAARPAFRCKHQSCYGPGMFCQLCIVARHQVLPTHWIQEWTGDFFKRVSLSTLGLVVQLGHTPGAACPTMRRGRYKFTLIDVNGLHNVANMNCLGKISSYHFLRSLELLTNADGLSPTPHRMMEGMKRAGRGHDDSGVGSTAQGKLALLFRGCPQPGKNLPDGWDKIDWKTRDPIIDDGLGYFCNRSAYKTWLRGHVDEQEISTCSGFQAMFLANAKRIKGLSSTGVGGVTYSNMDFIYFSAILNTIILWIILSYDIACQYSKNFWTRMGKLPDYMKVDVEKISMWFKVPNFHILGHKWPCHSPFSFHWMWGAGMTDGED
ncbi:hypothetical protein C8F04DRAFT_1197732, partial [Mycena alexandri]